ncbi:lipoprotein insertase outer membrane protein LolB [Basilea psittacipulmonis]|uniref:Outer-membrane lipoprotein LolB n=1 Tax=Basilea psittacipulmonis DSM 24701 TaxID=1072685 RepID=A0A077DE85_9BURK|nr:lipoprotein insertase outer membrane protein LolB [Basilea psittacipulmonis]AIL32471.1 hypothetical protein IX83_03360 [Basilea psittacipulmonis DSM 24701]
MINKIIKWPLLLLVLFLTACSSLKKAEETPSLVKEGRIAVVVSQLLPKKRSADTFNFMWRDFDRRTQELIFTNTLGITVAKIIDDGHKISVQSALGDDKVFSSWDEFSQYYFGQLLPLDQIRPLFYGETIHLSEPWKVDTLEYNQKQAIKKLVVSSDDLNGRRVKLTIVVTK